MGPNSNYSTYTYKKPIINSKVIKGHLHSKRKTLVFISLSVTLHQMSFSVVGHICASLFSLQPFAAYVCHFVDLSDFHVSFPFFPFLTLAFPGDISLYLCTHGCLYTFLCLFFPSFLFPSLPFPFSPLTARIIGKKKKKEIEDGFVLP